MISAMAPDQVIAVNGVELAVDDRASARRGQRLPLVLVHGFTGGRVDFADVIDDLARDRRVVAWDHRGHADSTNTGDPATYTFDQLADDAAGVLDGARPRALPPARALDGRRRGAALRARPPGAGPVARPDGHGR